MADAGDKLQLTEKPISSEARNLTIARTDTAAIALTYLVWAVLNYLHVKQKLQAELDQHCPADPMGKELETLPYLNSVIEETLRLYSPISQSLPRSVPAGGTTLCGYELPPGTIVSTQAYTFHSHPAVYPDPLRFDPDRWLNPAKAIKEAFMAWGAGSRADQVTHSACLGTHIARLDLMHATSLFFRTCGDAKIVTSTTTPEAMEYRDFFVIRGKCKITLQ